MTENQKIRFNQIQTQEKKKVIAVKSDVSFDIASKYSFDDLMKLKKNQLVLICEDLQTTKTGNKADLAKRILQVSDSKKYFAPNETLVGSLTVYPTLFGYICNDDLIDNDFVSEYVARNYYEVPAISIVKSVARSEGYIAGKEACIQIVENHFQEEIFQDICQGIQEEIQRLVKGYMVEIKDGQVHFLKDTFGRLYGAMYRVLSEYKNPSVTRRKETVVSVYVDKEGNKTDEMIVALNRQNAVSTLAKVSNIDDLINNQSLVEFIRFMKRSDASHFDTCFLVLSGRLQGLTFEEIALKYGFSKRTALRYMDRIRMIYHEFDSEMVTVHHTASNDDIGCTYRHSETSASGSYDFSYNNGMYRKYYTYAPTSEEFEGVVIPEKTDLANRFDEKPFVKPVLTGRDGLLPEYIRTSKFYSENLVRNYKK